MTSLKRFIFRHWAALGRVAAVSLAAAGMIAAECTGDPMFDPFITDWLEAHAGPALKIF